MSARAKAFHILNEVVLNNGYSQLLLKKELEKVPDQDKSIITTLVYGTIQNYFYMEYLWKKHVNRKLDDKRLGVLFSMACYEIVFLNSPDYAVLDEANELAKKINKRYAGFVNGVLRNVLRNSFEIEEENEIKKRAIETSHPEWLYRMWCKHYGEDVAYKIAQANNRKPKASCRFNRLKTTKQALIDKYGFKEGLLSEDALYLDGGNLASMKCYEDGEISIQDESSQMVAIVADPKENDMILDVCAAPGSKTMHMAERMNNTGHIIAHDLHASRVELMRNAATRLGVTNTEFKTFDSTKCHEEYSKESFNVVVVDAPCSGLGVMGRKPDIRLQDKQSSMDEILQIQAQILESVHELVKINGKLVYSTCSLNKKENEKQVESFVNKHPNYRIDYERTIFPYEYDSDGFYICRLIREK
ncbi:MAG: 16S rRNA (cytosine(967)-C(5))-methyltransferase RsmB [Erysipelotrichales bacterium]|nr:16S rRNA (cytosine(967)-C(5))-methyltransferase RsmB [Erysipelotrichales bacterium]